MKYKNLGYILGIGGLVLLLIYSFFFGKEGGTLQKIDYIILTPILSIMLVGLLMMVYERVKTETNASPWPRIVVILFFLFMMGLWKAFT